jgi:hypothetical protein
VLIVKEGQTLDFHLGASLPSQTNAFNKAIANHKQLRPPLADVLGASQEIPSKILITTKTWSAITRPQALATITISTIVFSMEIKNRHVP